VNLRIVSKHADFLEGERTRIGCGVHHGVVGGTVDDHGAGGVDRPVVDGGGAGLGRVYC
jgi:hypothetical protein